jgi:hypothetical protein
MEGTDKCDHKLELLKKAFRISPLRAWSACDPSIGGIYRVHQRDDSRGLRDEVAISAAAGHYTDTKNSSAIPTVRSSAASTSGLFERRGPRLVEREAPLACVQPARRRALMVVAPERFQRRKWILRERPANLAIERLVSQAER